MVKACIKWAFNYLKPKFRHFNGLVFNQAKLLNSAQNL